MAAMLDKLMLAMAAEIERQITPQIAEHKAGKWGSAQSHFSGPSVLFGTCQINGEVDLKSIARAALEAMREPDIDGIFDSDPESPFWYADAAKRDFTAMIDAILAEKPAGR